MSVLIKATEARTLVAGSQERKCALIDLANSEIKSQSQKGLRWAHLPNGITEEEAKYLTDLLIENGYKVTESNPQVSW